MAESLKLCPTPGILTASPAPGVTAQCLIWDSPKLETKLFVKIVQSFCERKSTPALVVFAENALRGLKENP